MNAVKPYPHLRVIKPFKNYPRGFILTEVTALYRAYLLERGWVELVQPIQQPAGALVEPVLVGGLDPVISESKPARTNESACPAPSQQSFSKRNKR